MPIYTYRCENCGVQFDRRQSFDDPQITRCPECNKKTLRKVFLPVGIVFKGSGFYATDHRSPSGASRSSSSDKSSNENKKDGEPTPAAASESKESKDSMDSKENKD